MIWTDNTLFSVRRLKVKQKNIVFVPNFLNKKLLQDLQKEALKIHKIVNCEVIVLRNYALVHNFLGYTHLYTILMFLDISEAENIFFCGTAGLLNQRNINKISLFSAQKTGLGVSIEGIKQEKLSLSTIKDKDIEILPSALSIDIVQRENKNWLYKYEKDYKIVDMELFFLRYYLQKEIKNILIATDSIEYEGVRFLSRDKNILKDKFHKAFIIIKEYINEKSSLKS